MHLLPPFVLVVEDEFFSRCHVVDVGEAAVQPRAGEQLVIETLLGKRPFTTAQPMTISL